MVVGTGAAVVVVVGASVVVVGLVAVVVVGVVVVVVGLVVVVGANVVVVVVELVAVSSLFGNIGTTVEGNLASLKLTLNWAAER